MSYLRKVEKQREATRRATEKDKRQKALASASGELDRVYQKAREAEKQIPTRIVEKGLFRMRFCSWCENPLRWWQPAHTNVTCPGRRVTDDVSAG